MDDLDRLYRRLIHNVRVSHPEYLQIPFTVQELYEQLVPYRHNRRELAIETNQDYETAVARLLSGERGYTHADPEMQEKLRLELNSPTGDPGIFKEYAQGQISLGPIAEQVLTPMPPPSATPSPPGPTLSSYASSFSSYATPAPAGAEDLGPSVPPVAQTASLLSSFSNMAVPTGCRFCGGTLPEGRDAHYCPHCGENLKTRRCPACGDEMDTSWAFCVTCGRRAS